MQNILMQKLGIAINALAIEFLSLKEGDRIKTVAELSDFYGTARGTIQSAVKYLKEKNAIELESRGHLGTFIKKIDYIKLLELTGIKSLVGVMPLPYSKRYEGLATGLYKVLNDGGVNTNLAFMRGSNNRLKTLEDGRYDFAITSRLTAEYYLKTGADIQIVKSFGEKTYVNEHVLMLANGFNGDFKEGTRVAIDYSSIDQYYLTERYFKELNVNYIPLNYNQVIEATLNNEVDVAIWNIDDILEKNYEVKYIHIEKEKKCKEDEACIICMKDNLIIPVLFNRMLNGNDVVKYQNLILENKMMPQY